MYQNNHPHTFQNTYITNTHTLIRAHGRLQKLQSELVLLVSHCMRDVIWQVLAAGPGHGLCYGLCYGILAGCVVPAAPQQSLWYSHLIHKGVHTHTHICMHAEKNTMTHLVVIAEESRSSYVAGHLA